ncbi:probable sporulation protein, polysaccharide deacetylase family [Paenibacillus sophorae]|uniref:Polysaccharide deacetylase family protein n=1 Tax=Paenibacillus sophorae TaxID=1333845 RepID=A0A1H8G7Y7_9BACL|nr:polysaccharide deacetylase family protein [Paenibacillus sophorae]QWU14122.1 polysaccharide deacetylase family protein [Paenibacillus sophorae]SEN39860.1 probable sporulation protein, polysaccharide deacetylase family [Paenibacillus sophorae]
MRLEKAAVVLACMAIVIGIGSSVGPVKSMLGQLRASGGLAVLKPLGDAENDLRSQIEAKAAQVDSPPVDARVDRVWKAIPGYNGLSVDVEGTYKEALLLPAGEAIKYVYKQTAPAVSLDELGAQPIYRGNPAKPMVSLMINVAWGNEYIVPMLNILDEEHVKATFFLDGSWLSKNRELAMEIQKRGHELENHAYSHPNMSTLSRARAVMEIDKTKKLLKSSLGVDNRWFAPPSGDFDQETVEIARELGLKTVLWTVDTVDWRNPSPESVVAKITANAEPGTLVLMHPTSSSSKALRGMIRGIKAKGLVLGTVSQTLSPERVLPSDVE